LFGFLFAFWLALSGHYTPLLMTIGAVCALLCALLAVRLDAVDREGHPVHLLGRVFTYYPWLAREIVKSAWGVSKVILDPRLPISPTLTVVKSSQTSAAGIATYANSITLTPGTLTVGVNGSDLLVHALTREGALELEAGGMDRRVSQFEGSA
jgi:multicomponent Na+:H+ antiporter subunit E